MFVVAQLGGEALVCFPPSNDCSPMHMLMYCDRRPEVQQTNQVFRLRSRRDVIQNHVALFTCATNANPTNQNRLSPKVVSQPDFATQVYAWLCDEAARCQGTANGARSHYRSTRG